MENLGKTLMSKIPPKSPCANFQSLGIFKNSTFIQKRIFPSLSAHPAFRTCCGPFFFFSTGRFSPPSPLGLSLSVGPAHPHGPTGHFFFLPYRSQARTVPPAGLAPPPRSTPTPPPEEKKMAASIPLHSPINRRHFPLFNHQ
jgi:hypothetical protein